MINNRTDALKTDVNLLNCLGHCNVFFLAKLVTRNRLKKMPCNKQSKIGGLWRHFVNGRKVGNDY